MDKDSFIVESNKSQLAEVTPQPQVGPVAEASIDEPSAIVEPTTEVKEEAKPQGKSRAQRRIETLVQEKHDLARQLEEAKATKPAVKELSPDDYEDYDDYLKAVKTTPKEVTKEAKADDSKLVIEQANERFEDTREKYDDFDDKVEGMPILTVDMLRVLNESDEAGEVTYYLANNPKEAKALSQLSLGRMAIEIGKIEVKLSMPKVEKPIIKKVTTAQDPITPVGGSNMPPRTVADAQTQAEYEAIRSAQTKSRNGWS